MRKEKKREKGRERLYIYIYLFLSCPFRIFTKSIDDNVPWTKQICSLKKSRERDRKLYHLKGKNAKKKKKGSARHKSEILTLLEYNIMLVFFVFCFVRCTRLMGRKRRVPMDTK